MHGLDQVVAMATEAVVMATGPEPHRNWWNLSETRCVDQANQNWNSCHVGFGRGNHPLSVQNLNPWGILQFQRNKDKK